MRYVACLSLPVGFLLSCSIASGQVMGTVSSTGQASVSARPAGTCGVTIPPMRGVLTSGQVAPYSATQESSHTQTAADGTVFSSKQSPEKVWQDSQGRIRTERPVCRMHGTEETESYAEIRDPVAGYGYILDPTTHTAHRFALKVRERGTPPPKPAEVAATLGVPIRPAPASAQFVSESLGSQTMEGVPVEGTRTTETVPAEQMDNDRPFNIVRESWTSPALHMSVYSKTSDPRYGETITRLTNVELTEPDPALFRPPADYTVVDNGGEPVKLTVQWDNVTSRQQ